MRLVDVHLLRVSDSTIRIHVALARGGRSWRAVSLR